MKVRERGNWMLTPTQVAEILAVNEATVTVWLRSGKLTGLKVGQRWRVHAEALELMIRSNGELQTKN